MDDRSTIITFTSDFGNRDGYVGIVKGSIKKINREVEIIDLSHELEPFDVNAASFITFNSYKYFPEGSVHLVVVDPQVGSEQRRILVEVDNHFFVGPDSGVFSMVLNYSDKDSRAWHLTNKAMFSETISATFHARDIFGPVASHLASGLKPNRFGPQIEIDSLNFTSCGKAQINGRKVAGEVIFVDRFGNLITNISQSIMSSLPVSDSLVCHIGNKEIDSRATSYASVVKGEILFIEGSHGFLEIAVNQGSAKDMLNVDVGEKVTFEL